MTDGHWLVSNKGNYMTDKGISFMEVVLSVTREEGFSVREIVLSVTNKGIFMGKEGLSAMEKGISVMELVKSVTNKGISMSKEGLFTANQGLSAFKNLPSPNVPIPVKSRTPRPWPA